MFIGLLSGTKPVTDSAASNKFKVFSNKNNTISSEDIENNVGLICEKDSLISLTLMLGLSKTTIRRYLNTISSVYSPKLQMDVFIVNINRPLTNDKVNFDMPKFGDILDFDCNSLPIGKLVALFKNKDPNNYYGVYDSATQAALILDGRTDARYISRYINKERLVRVTANNDLVYFVMNPDTPIRGSRNKDN